MTCRWVRRRLDSYVEAALGAVETGLLRWHLGRCRECLEEYERVEAVGDILVSLPQLRPPPALRLRILSAISKDHNRAGHRVALAWARLTAGNLLRPVLVPVLGGLSMALVILPLLLSVFWVEPVAHAEDVPLRILASPVSRAPKIRAPSPYPVAEDVTVVAHIDSRGVVYDYLIAGGPPIDARALSELANTLLTSQFEPAEHFGQPCKGTTVILFQRIDTRM